VVDDRRADRGAVPIARLSDDELRARSGLPGARANLELAAQAAEEADDDDVERWLASGEEYLTFCGVIALGRLGRVDELRRWASDERWRIREATAMGLQRLGDDDRARMVAVAEEWSRGAPLEQRAAIAGLCEPRHIRDPEVAAAALRLLEAVTVSLRDSRNRVLRKALGYCWSVAVAASPETGLPLFERLSASDDPDVQWIVRENRKKARLRRLLE
jgi:hypothetical protein